MFFIPVVDKTEYEQAAYFADDYELFAEFNGEPTVITVHRIGFTPDARSITAANCNTFTPIENICIFSKAHAVRELSRLHQKYASSSHKEGVYTIQLDTRYGEHYTSNFEELAL
jgi:hypothetical protein